MADLGVRINDDVGKQPHVVAEPAVVRDVVATEQGRACADLDALPNHATRTDMCGGINLRGGRDRRRRMDAGSERCGRKKQRDHLRGRDACIGHPDDDFRGRSERLRNQNRRRRAGFGGGEVALFFRKGEVAGLRAVGGGETGERGLAVADNFALEQGGEVRGGKRHRGAPVTVPARRPCVAARHPKLSAASNSQCPRAGAWSSSALAAPGSPRAPRADDRKESGG